MMGRKREAIVKVTDQGQEHPALIQARRRATADNYWLGPSQREAMGGRPVAYFTAERIGDAWVLGQRLPDVDRDW